MSSQENYVPFAGRKSFVMSQDPNLVGGRCQEFRSLIARVSELVAPFPHLLCVGQDPVHGPHRAQVGLLLQERCKDFSRSPIDEPLLVQTLQRLSALAGRPSTRRRQPHLRRLLEVRLS
ncbi:MAG: hypothetical protein FJW35_19190 [Acidobacteria bacterium]|nr:hypothetical protein [Acidobacteriota bacterium]